MDSLELKLCDIQGRLFELSVAEGYDSEKFVPFFMNSEVAKSLDSKYNRMQWAGEEYLLEELQAEGGEKLIKGHNSICSEIMYWIGYIYRYWHYLKGESSVKIYRQANVNTMRRNYTMFHTMDPELAIDDLIEIAKFVNPHMSAVDSVSGILAGRASADLDRHSLKKDRLEKSVFLL